MNLTGKQRFLRACRREFLDRPPLWIMRQAGRYLPEYQALKEKHSFLEMVQTPELAARVTLQPLQRFDLDAAILFSDILVIPEAMGQPYAFRDGGGIAMEYALESADHIQRLRPDTIQEKLSYVFSTIATLKKELNDQQALLGFGGSPWTLATYMVEGGSSKSFARIKSLFYTDPGLFERLLEKITTALTEYFRQQIRAGVDAIQIFDSWGGVLSPSTYWNASGKYMHQIIRNLENTVPVIVFSKGAHGWIEPLKQVGADVLGVDWTVSIHEFYDQLGGETAVQGNLDPAILNTHPDVVQSETKNILTAMQTRPGHIFNLGHGILPDARLDCVERLVETVTCFQNRTSAAESTP